jgi:UPF0176 protein
VGFRGAAIRRRVNNLRRGTDNACVNPIDLPRTIPAALLHSAFYRFVPLADTATAAQALRGAAQGLTGSIVVANEGVNGSVAGVAADVQAFEAALRGEAVLGGALRGMAFKHSACTTAPFGRLKVSIKPEIVALGLPVPPGTDALPPPDEDDASHLSPAAWRELLQRDDVVLLDNRNHFEVRLGRFRGAIDPQVGHFRDFIAYVQAHAPLWRAQGRTVAMYCTGGIRCDKTAPWLRSQGLEVRQLAGGILHYCQQLDDAERDWEGECFVFDKRIALDSRLRETATTAEQVFDAQRPDEAWRLQRAQRLDDSRD